MKSPEAVPFGAGAALLPVVDEDVGVAPVAMGVAGAPVAGAPVVFAAGEGL